MVSTGAGIALERAASGRRRPAAVGSLAHAPRAAPSATGEQAFRGKGFSQNGAGRVMGHQSLAADMWGWGFRWHRRPTVYGGEALCEERGAVARRQAV